MDFSNSKLSFFQVKYLKMIRVMMINGGQREKEQTSGLESPGPSPKKNPFGTELRGPEKLL